MREAAEKKKELEKQHSDAVNELRTAQAQLGLLTNSKNAESERAQLSQNIESLQVREPESPVPFRPGSARKNNLPFLSHPLAVCAEPDQGAREEDGAAERASRRAAH